MMVLVDVTLAIGGNATLEGTSFKSGSGLFQTNFGLGCGTGLPFNLSTYLSNKIALNLTAFDHFV